MPLMASPRPFYPLQQPADVPPDFLAERSARVLLQPRGRMAPASVAVPRVLGSASTSLFPVKLPVLQQSPRTTSLPGRAESKSSGRVRELSSTLLPLYAALHDAQHCQKVNRPDPLT